MRSLTCLAGLALGLLSTTACAQYHNSTGKWWDEPFQMFQTNLRNIDLDMDVDEVADFIQDYGATAWLQSVGGILANYPSKFDYHTINPHLKYREGGDLVKDSLDAARARDLRFLGRLDFSKVHVDVAEAHPEWLYISPNGTWQNHTGDLVSVCPNGEWYQERIFDILGEVMDEYSPDGFFVNWAGMNERDYFRVYHGVCHCNSCKKAWAEHSDGAELPDGDWSENYGDWKVWSDSVIDAWTAKVRDYIAAKDPDVGLILGIGSDVMFYEANNALDREIWHHATEETVSRHKSHRPERPVLVNCASFLDHAYRITSEDPHHFAQYHLQAMARGANPSTYIIGIPGKIPWPGLEQSGELVRFHKTWKDVYTGLKPVAKTALALPHDSQMDEDFFDEQAMPEYKGLYKSLQELHIPFDIVDQRYFPNMSETGGLSRYDTIILGNLGRIDDEGAEALDNWVSDGGTLVVSGATGVEDDGSLQLKSLPASSQRENFTDFEDLWSIYFAPEQNKTEEHYYQGPLIPLIGSYSLYEWKKDAKGLYKKLGYAPFAPPEYIYGNTQVNERAVGIGPADNGTGVLFTMPVGWGYRETGLGVFRDFLELVIGEVGSGEPLEFDLAPQVEVTVNVNRQGQTVVHLINLSGIRYQNFGQHVKLPGGKIKVRGGEDVTARSLRGDVLLEVYDGAITVPGIDLFDVIVIEGL